MQPKNNIKKIRNQRGWNQGQLAELMGVGTSTVEKLENGKMKLNAEYQIAAAKSLGCDISEILSEKEKPLPQAEVLMMSVFVDILSLLVGRQIPKDQIIEKISYRKASFEKYQMHHSLRLLKILEDCVHDKSRAAELQLVQLFSAPYQAKED